MSATHHLPRSTPQTGHGAAQRTSCRSSSSSASVRRRAGGDPSPGECRGAVRSSSHAHARASAVRSAPSPSAVGGPSACLDGRSMSRAGNPSFVIPAALSARRCSSERRRRCRFGACPLDTQAPPDESPHQERGQQLRGKQSRPPARASRSLLPKVKGASQGSSCLQDRSLGGATFLQAGRRRGERLLSPVSPSAPARSTGPGGRNGRGPTAKAARRPPPHPKTKQGGHP